MSDADPMIAITAKGPDLVPERHGAKAVGLQRLVRAGLPVPPAFVVPIGAPLDADRLARAVADLGGRVAVRSGAPVSLPGALDTVLDVGPGEVRPAAERVLDSAASERARATAAALGYDGAPETAVIVQRHVDSAADGQSGAGAATSRDPLTGRRRVRGSLVWGGSGESVMAGSAEALPLEAMVDRTPELHVQLVADLHHLDTSLGTGVEVEFAIERGRLWYLQLRTFAVDEPARVDAPAGIVLATGTPASAGVAQGRLHVDLDDALDASERGDPVVLVRPTTSPADVTAMVRSVAVVTAIGSRESHAAVVARSVGIPAVVGVMALEIADDHVRLGDQRVEVGESLVVDGSRGAVLRPEPADGSSVQP